MKSKWINRVSFIGLYASECTECGVIITTKNSGTPDGCYICTLTEVIGNMSDEINNLKNRGHCCEHCSHE